MSGISYLLDTNVVIGLLQGHPPALVLRETKQLEFENCAVSQITRMELLSFPDLQAEEENAIRGFLDNTVVLLLSDSIEKAAIALRRKLKIHLPDAIIAATAQINRLELLTLDERLRKALATPV